MEATTPKLQSDSFHKLNRPEQVILFRLRTGHDTRNAHMYSKFKAGESEMWPCNVNIMTTEHLLQHRQLHDTLRRDMWPEPTPLRDMWPEPTPLRDMWPEPTPLRDMWPEPTPLRDMWPEPTPLRDMWPEPTPLRDMWPEPVPLRDMWTEPVPLRDM